MRRFLRDWWPLAAAALLAFAFAREIPRKALLPEPKTPPLARPRASFIVLEQDAAHSILAKSRATWRMNSSASWLAIAPDWREDALFDSSPHTPYTLPDSAIPRFHDSTIPRFHDSPLPSFSAYAPPSEAAPEISTPDIKPAPLPSPPPFSRSTLLSLEDL